MVEGGRPMPISAHLEELRTRLIRCVLAAGVGMALAFWRMRDLMAFLRRPLDLVIAEIGPGWVELVQLKVYGSFVASMKVAFFAGSVLASPIIVHQIWAFVAAGLYRHERRSVKFYVIPGFVLFLAGAALAYLYLMPLALRFLLPYASETMDGVKSTLDVNAYVSLVAGSMLVFGLAFQMPLIMVFLMRLGVVQPAFFRRYRRHAIVTIVALAAVLTPPDVASQIVMSVALIVLYEIAILVGVRVARARTEGPR